MARMITMLDNITATYFAGCLLRLYKNNYNPVLGSAAGNFTESTFAGYASIAIGAGGGAFDNGASQAENDWTLQTFICTAGGPENVYGWYITVGGVIVCAQRDPAAPFAISAGMTYSVLLQYLLENQ